MSMERIHGPKAILFDFFGTLVNYDPKRTSQRYDRAHSVAVALGYRGSHDEFSHAWDQAAEGLEQVAVRSGLEFSMTQVALAFASAVELKIEPQQAMGLGKAYVAEWRRHVRPVRGVADMLTRLSARFRLAVVSNTHDRDLVPAILLEMGVSELFHAVVLSVEHGTRKPGVSIFRSALDQLGCEPEHALFVGDSLEADYLAASRLGLRAMLIDPARAHGQPIDSTISSVLEVERLVSSPR